MNSFRRWIYRRRCKRLYEEHFSDVGDHLFPRIALHAQLLDEFFDRWLAFLRIETLDPPSMLDGHLFLVVEADSRHAAGDIARLTGPQARPIKEAWADYMKSLADLRKQPQSIKAAAEETYRKLGVFTRAVAMDKLIHPDAYSKIE